METYTNKNIRDNELVCFNCRHLLDMTKCGLGYRCSKNKGDSFPDAIPSLLHHCSDFKKTGLKKDVTKEEVLKAWENLIDILYDYLQVTRSRGGTMGHKVGSFYTGAIEKLNAFKNNI